MKKDFNPENPDFILIDLNVLHLEWLHQAELFLYYSNKSEKASFKLSEIDAEMNLLKADLEDIIRTNPKKYNLPDNVTGQSTVIKNRILQHKKYKEVLQKYNKQKYKCGLLVGLLRSLEHRKRALEWLCELHGRNYFAEPKATKQMKEYVNKYNKDKARSKMVRDVD